MLTLKEVKPCTLIVHGDFQALFTRMVKKCLEPVIKSCQLKQYGFLLQQITHPIPTTNHWEFQNEWIFADTRSPQWNDVKNLFLTPHPGRKANEPTIEKALGYPINRKSPRRGKSIYYIDYTKRAKLRTLVHDNTIYCVVGMKYFCPEYPQALLLDNLKTINTHFQTYFQAAKNINWSIKIDFEGYPALRDEAERPSWLCRDLRNIC